ncbi:MAG: DNA mismatch repair protein MutS, partial [Bacteroidales bacterium]|nr:DNA mismatch repair protein MutS [Bacteroidales bacterium]
MKESGTIQKDNLTPMMRQYFDMKKDCPEAVLLFRCGDFYETYGDDAITASKILGIVLTKRSSVTANPIPMAGVPYHALNTYLPKLVRAGYKVAICDQLEDPKLTKNIVKRGITELITPGIAFNDQLLEQKQNNFIASMCFQKDSCGAAFLDVSTGEFQVAEGDLDYIGTLLSSFSPKEILVERGYERGVKERFGSQWYVSTVEEWAFTYESALKRLCKQLEVKSLKGFGLSRTALGVSAAGALMVYLEQTHHADLKNICSITRIDRGAFVWMDQFTLRNLEIFASASGRDGVSLVDVIDKCSSPMGARLLRHWLAMPIMDRKELSSRYDVVDHFISDKEGLESLQEMIGDLGDLERIMSRVATGKIAPREVMMLARGLSQIGPISRLCLGHGVEPLEALVSELSGCEDLLSEIVRTMHPDPASQLGKGDVIGSGVNEELDQLRNISRNAKDYLL